MIRTATLALALLALASCSNTLRHDSLRSQLEERTLLPTRDSLTAMASARPTLTAPFRLGIAPPWIAVDPETSRSAAPGFGAWSKAERDLLGQWIERAVTEGSIEEASFIPSLLIDEALPPLQAARLAGDLQHVDAVLLVQRATDHSRWTDGWGVLYFTLIGMVVVPADHVEAMTVADGFVIEVGGDGYIYTAARGEARTEDNATPVNIDRLARRQLDQSRAAALDQLCEQLSLMASGE